MPPSTPARRQGDAPDSGGAEAFEAADAAQVDAVEDHLELSGAEFHAGAVRRRCGEVVASLLQTLAPQAQAVTAPVEHLEAVGRAIAENEQVSG